MNILIKGTSNVRAVTTTLQYQGTFLDIPFLTVVVKSPTAVAFEIGDYIVWEYDGNEYYLKDIPSEAKQARVGTYGEAFIYENVKFVSRLSDTKNVSFLDVVAPESGLHYTTLPTFSFYGKVSDLISRINANLGRLYANWSVVEADLGEAGDVYEAMQEYREVEVSNISCWEAIGLVYSLWKLGFVYSYVGGVNTITIGAQYVNTNPFSYGQGNGLYLIRKNIAQEDSIVTRLRAYGSADNMPPRYYNNIMIGGSPLISEMQYIPNLMIPYSKWGTTAGVPDVQKAYIDADNADVDAADTSMDKYGVREKTLYFDGSGDLEDIKPTIERLTAGELRAAITSYAGTQVYYAPSITYADSDRMDVIKVADDTADDGNVDSAIWYDEEAEYLGEQHNYNVSSSVFSTVLDPMYGATLSMAGEYKVTFTGQTQVITSLNTTINSGVMRVWLLKNGNRSSLKASVDGTLGLTDITFTIPTFNVNVDEGGDAYSIELAFELFVLPPIGEEGILTLTTDEGTATYAYTKSIPNNRFSIQIREVGFDIMKFLAGGGQNPSISMKTGACAGREFVIRSTERVTDGWKLNCVRQADTSLNQQLFPNNIFKIAEGDTFVLLNMSMPEILVETNSIRLYNKGCEWLRKAKEPVLVYEPLIDEVYMAHNPELIKEGMAMPITDTDLGIDEVVLINSVTIEENGESIRTYSVVLREQGDTSLISYINSRTKQQANSTVRYIVNAVTATTQSAEVLSSFAAPAQEETSYSAILSALEGKHPLNGTLELDFKARELWATRLRLPKTAPTSMTDSEWYVSVAETGFAGEEPSGGSGKNNFWELDDVNVSTKANGQVAVYNSTTTKWTNTTLLTSHITESGNLFYTDARVKAYGDVNYLGITAKAADSDKLDGYNYNQFGGYVSAVSDIHAIGGQNLYTFFNSSSYPTNSPVEGAPWVQGIQFSLAENATYRQIIASANNNLYFGNQGNGVWEDWRKIWDSGNSNKTSVDWSAKSLTLEGSITGATNIAASGTIQMAENNNTRLRVPKTTPSGMTATEWYVSISTTGFAGEEPSGGGGVTLFSSLTDTALTAASPYNSGMLGRVPMLTDIGSGVYKWRDTALQTSHISGLDTALNARMITANYPDLTAIEALSETSGLLKKTASNTWALDNSSYLTTTGVAYDSIRLGNVLAANYFRKDETYFMDKYVLEGIPKRITQVGSFGWIDYQTTAYPGGMFLTLKGFSSLSSLLMIFPDYANNDNIKVLTSIDGSPWGQQKEIAWKDHSHSLTSLIGSSAIGGSTTPIYYNGSAFVAGTALGQSAFHPDSYFALASHNQAWSTITDKPTTINGYGITDSNYHYAAVSDLNNIADFGTFASSSNPTNAVSGSSYMSGIQVLIDGNSECKKQLAHNYNDGFWYKRNQGGGVWGSWKKIWDEDNLNKSYVPFAASTLTLNGAITGATTLGASGIVTLSNTTQSTAYTNGALVLSGGLGIAKDLFSNGKAVFASSVQMAENINTRLTIPSSTPTGMTAGRWYISIV